MCGRAACSVGGRDGRCRGTSPGIRRAGGASREPDKAARRARPRVPHGLDLPPRRRPFIDAAALRVGLHPRLADDRLLFRRVLDGVGPPLRLRRRGEFRPDFPDRARRLHGRHPRQSVPAPDMALPHRRRLRGDRRRGRARIARTARPGALFRSDDARRRADPAELHRRGGEPHGWGDRAHRARRDLDRRRCQLLDRARLHGGERGRPLCALALAGRSHPAGERAGRRAGWRSRAST